MTVARQCQLCLGEAGNASRPNQVIGERRNETGAEKLALNLCSAHQIEAQRERERERRERSNRRERGKPVRKPGREKAFEEK